MLNFMNNSHNTPDDTTPPDEELSQTQLDARAAATTVFSDGSTFDYENGYQNNGAPVATRDREEKPTIAKSHKIFTGERLLITFLSAMILAVVAGGALFGVSSFQHIENNDALRAAVNGSDQVKIVQISKDDALVKRPDGSFFKCAVSYASDNGHPVGLLFCTAGGPSTFTIPLPHDPNNLFYTGPTDK